MFSRSSCPLALLAAGGERETDELVLKLQINLVRSAFLPSHPSCKLQSTHADPLSATPHVAALPAMMYDFQVGITTPCRASKRRGHGRMATLVSYHPPCIVKAPP